MWICLRAYLYDYNNIHSLCLGLGLGLPVGSPSETVKYQYTIMSDRSSDRHAYASDSRVSMTRCPPRTSSVTITGCPFDCFTAVRTRDGKQDLMGSEIWCGVDDAFFFVSVTSKQCWVQTCLH